MCTAVSGCVGMQPDARAEEEAMPLAIAHQIVDGSLFDDALPPGRADAHLARLKKALHLYVNAKYIDHMKFTTLEDKLAEIPVGTRSVNGAWAFVSKALKQASLSTEQECAAVASSLITSLSYVLRQDDISRLTEEALRLKQLLAPSLYHPVAPPGHAASYYEPRGKEREAKERPKSARDPTHNTLVRTRVRTPARTWCHPSGQPHRC